MNNNSGNMDWFTHDRFGMFMHWGIYSLSGKEEWVMSQEKMTKDEYHRYFDRFDPQRFDAKEIARQAKNAGMKYVVLTAKHHDGFCLFDSKLTDYTSMHTKSKRDFVREYVEAVRSEGLKVGLYFSLIDWSHDDFPKYNDMFHPMRGNPEYENEKIDFDKYLDFMHAQIREICTNYGKLDILWFDFSYGDLKGEKWRATELINMVRSLQPGIIIDNRLEGGGSSYGSLLTSTPKVFAGDFISPEHHIPPFGFVNDVGKQVPWELCTTMNNHWCYHPFDKNFKSASLLIHTLVDCVSKNGNMLLNVGPTGDGDFPEESSKILKELGAWIKRNGESIYGAGRAPYPQPEWGRYTKKGNIVYAHIFEVPIGPIGLFGIEKDKIESVTLLADGIELSATGSFAERNNPTIKYASLGENANYTYPMPDMCDTVLKIVIKE